MGEDAAQYGNWGNGSRVVEVEEIGDDSGAEVIGQSLVRRKPSYQVVDDLEDEDLTSSEGGDDDDDDDDDDYQDLTPEEEEIFVKSALLRISKAQARGKTDVKLNKAELAALERRRQRMEQEERKQRKKRKEQRVAVPLAQFESLTRKTRTSRQPSGEVDPPMGYFPPMSGSRSQSSSLHATSQDDAWPVAPNHDPFQYQTEGPRVPSGTRNAAPSSRRHGSSSSGGSSTSGLSDLSYRPSRSSGASTVDRASLEGENDEATKRSTVKDPRRSVQTRAATRTSDNTAAPANGTATSGRGGASARGVVRRSGVGARAESAKKK